MVAVGWTRTAIPYGALAPTERCWSIAEYIKDKASGRFQILIRDEVHARTRLCAATLPFTMRFAGRGLMAC